MLFLIKTRPARLSVLDLKANWIEIYDLVAI